MTMSLVRGMTSLNTKKRKASKMTKGRLERLQVQHREHNKSMKRIHAHSNVMTFDEYVDYVSGNFKSKITPKTNTDWQWEGPKVRETEYIPSKVTKDSFAPATKRESMQYTGERRLVGIAMMHKSNLVPVFADDDDKTGSKQATEIAQMRRN
ncbi:hypothetical protein OAR23_00385 [bacterium]|jgi:hypothetical protein|nr:hypothetical protein [bacterium]|tara:strand:+ start:656 stop:1111 length:456 start_codon:yes stop_codon:yes gene_type:complete